MSQCLYNYDDDDDGQFVVLSSGAVYRIINIMSSLAGCVIQRQEDD